MNLHSQIEDRFDGLPRLSLKIGSARILFKNGPSEANVPIFIRLDVFPVEFRRGMFAGRFTKLERRTNRRFASVDARFDDVDARFAAVDARLDRMEARISARLDSVIEKLDTHFLINKNHFDHHTVILHEHDDRLKDLERQTGT